MWRNRISSWARRHIYTVATTRQLTGHASCIQCLAPAKCSGKTGTMADVCAEAHRHHPKRRSTQAPPRRMGNHLKRNTDFHLRALPHDHKPHHRTMPEYTLILTKMTDTPRKGIHKIRSKQHKPHRILTLQQNIKNK